MFKKIIRLTLFALLALSAVFERPALAEQRIKIGVSTALTGSAASYGQDVKNAILFANEKLGHGKYELIFEDDKCSSKDGVAIAHRFIDLLKIKYVLGFACSAPTLAAAPLYERAGVTVITSSASAPAIANAGSYIYRTFPSDKLASKRLFDYIMNKQTKLGVVTEETEYTQGFIDSLLILNFSKEIPIINYNLIGESADYRTILTRLKQQEVDSLFINAQTEISFLNILKQSKEIGLNVQTYGVYWPSSPAFLDKANGLGDGIITVDTPAVGKILNENGKTLYAEFIKKYGKMNSIEAVFVSGFESFRALTQAIESGKEIRSYLNKTKFNGVAGEWTFDENGDIEGLDFVLKRIKDSQAFEVEGL